MVHQLFGGPGATVPLQVVGRGAGQHGDIGKLAHHQGGVFWRRHPYRHIETLGHHVHESVLEAEFQADIRITPVKFGKVPGKNLGPEKGRCTDPQVTARRTSLVRDLLLQRFQFAQQPRTALVEDLAASRQAEAPRGSIEQTHPEAALQPTYILAYCPFLQVEHLRGGCKAALLHHHAKHTDVGNMLQDLVSLLFTHGNNIIPIWLIIKRMKPDTLFPTLPAHPAGRDRKHKRGDRLMTAKHYDFDRAQAFFQDRLSFTTGTHELEVLINGDTDPASYQVVDVRFPDDYAQSRIPGAINLPMPKWGNQRYLETHLNKDATLYLYCYTPTCHLAAQAAAQLAAAGYRVVEVEGGWSTWLASEYAVEHGTTERAATSA